jgi:hypothetical protein
MNINSAIVFSHFCPLFKLMQLLDSHVLYLTTEECEVPYIFESNPHLVAATFLNEKKLVRTSNPHFSFNRPLRTGRLFE